MRYTGLFFLLILLPWPCLSKASQDSLVEVHELVFKNEIEKNTFSKITGNQTPDPVDLFLAPYLKETEVNPTDIHQKINDCIRSLRERIADKSASKKTKIIYEEVHRVFFKVYKLNNSFCDIFTKGEYNCVSATALYALIFSKLEIPYDIKETPTHVYLEVFPGSDKILIETTSPEKGYYKFSDEFASNYVQMLIREKVLLKSALDSSSVTDLFNKYYFSSGTITLQQLAGLQYSNYGIYFMDENKYEAGIQEFRKSYYLFPGERHKLLLKHALLSQLQNNNYKSMNQVYHLVSLCHFNNIKDEDLSDEVIKHEFGRIIQSQLIDNTDYEKFDSSYSCISKTLTDSSIRNDIAFYYHYELARLGLVNTIDTSSELMHLKAAYAINPRQADLQTMILRYLLLILDNKNGPESVLNLINDYSLGFSFLENSDLFNSVRANCLLELSFRNFMINKPSAGDLYIKQFEDLYSRLSKQVVSHEFIEKTYSTAAGFYFKKGNYTRSKQILKSGLNYLPESYKLKQMLTQL